MYVNEGEGISFQVYFYISSFERERLLGNENGGGEEEVGLSRDWREERGRVPRCTWVY